LFEGLDGDAGYLGRQIFGLSDSWMATPELKLETGNWEVGCGQEIQHARRCIEGRLPWFVPRIICRAGVGAVRSSDADRPR
jgi:hypothetical protein